MRLAITLVSLLTFYPSPHSCQEEDWGLWPVFTPLLGVSSQCLEASQQYMRLLSEALTTTAPLTERQKNAVQMFDANGRFPFLQEGALQDISYMDLCDSVLEAVPNCRENVPLELRFIRIPKGNANGPGSESGCKAVSGAKYCHNYWQFYVDPKMIRDDKTSARVHQNQKQNIQVFDAGSRPLTIVDFSSLVNKSQLEQVKLDSIETHFKPSEIVDLYDLLVEKNSYFRLGLSQLKSLYGNTTLFPQYKDDPIPSKQLAGILLNFWVGVNWLNGVGQFAFSYPIAYQGMCFPSACSMEDIQINSFLFGSQYYVEGLGLIFNCPVINEGLGKLLNGTAKDTIRQSVGCSDDEVYIGGWNTANYIIVTMLGIIAALILIGTVVDLYHNDDNNNKKKQTNIGYQLLMAFSIIENTKFVFEAPAKGGSARFGCLEGMRSLSMTWVILGHHFMFAGSGIHVRNKEYFNYVRSQHGGGFFFEAILQGEYSVDTFLFIGATLLSYLLLKDLDKSNGWFSSGKGFVRMILFYINRYLRISIPYALTMAVFIGVIPLTLRDSMDAGRLAYSEAEECKRVMGYKLAYINIFPDFDGACIGQTWYLSCDMMLFILSPLLIYPLWMGKFGSVRRVLSILWWFSVFGTSCSFAYWYIYHMDTYGKWEEKYHLPQYNFSPWGWRNQCYILGIMTGYFLWLTKDKNVVIDRKFNFMLWCCATVIGLLLVYVGYSDFNFESQRWLDKLEWRSYYAFRKAGWGLCLMWVTFSCCRGYGGFINDFLSWGFWLPISKVSFMAYLFHMSINWEFFLLQSYQLDYSLWQLTAWFVPQVWVCLLAGLLGSLTLELPFGKIQKILIQQLLKLIPG